jgi:multiple sugar transport system permease protein
MMNVGLISEPIQWFTTDKYVLPLIIAVQLWMSMGIGFLAMRAGASTVDVQFYEAAAIDGVKNRLQEVFYITIPLMAPHLMTAAVLQITAMFANTSVSMNLAGFPSTNYSGHLIMTHMLDYSVYRVERGYACTIAVLLFTFMILINRFVLRSLRKVGE